MPTHEGPGYNPPTRQTQITSQAATKYYEPWLSEGNNNAQHTTGAYIPDDSAIAPYGDPSATSPFGAPISFIVEPPAGKAIDGYISKVTLTPYTVDGDSCEGSFVDGQGNPLFDGMVKIDDDGIIYSVSVDNDTCVITVDSAASSWKPVDFDGFGGLHYVPVDAESDLDVYIDASVTLASKTLTRELPTPFYIDVDAVADLPEYMGGADASVSFEPSDSENPNLAPVTEYENGVVSHTIGGAALGSEKQAVLSLGDASFTDFADGSEEHFVLVACQDDSLPWRLDTSLFGTTGYEAFPPPQNGTLETFWLNADKTMAESGDPGAVMYYKVLIDNEYLAEHEGRISLGLPLIVEAESEGGSYLFDLTSSPP
ncbi:MAG: hypothetical protein LBD42_06830 [Desulfovibrio sp.]|jgi:hypothetical protein|nr:hypothetical protein [Desulfovibrio sp.]